MNSQIQARLAPRAHAIEPLNRRRQVARVALVGGRLHWLAVLLGLRISVAVSNLQAAELPVACTAGTCGAGVPSFVTSGQISAVLSGNTLGITQSSDSAVLNWRSFNISKDGRVTFVQPDASSIAINRIFDADPSRIFGALQANGRIYLINQNGILFGEGARVDVGGLIASTLDITPDALDLGIARASVRGTPAFAAFRDASGNASSGPITVEQGASLTTQEGGQIFLFAPQIDNRGTISTPGGQAMLAAGDSVFLQSSADPNLRGLYVEVGVGGTVTNGVEANAGQTTPSALVGQIIAERGNVTLAGLAVNQLGRVSATTSVRSNGSIRLLARDGGNAAIGSGFLTATNGGDLTVGPNSATEVLLVDAPDDKTVDVNTQPTSVITMDGRRVNVLDNAKITATGGDIEVSARRNALLDLQRLGSADADDSRIYVADGATLDVSGAQAELPMESNVIPVELRGSQLADSPDQRDGALRGQTVMVDVRATGTRSDGSVWVGTPIGDVSGDISTIQRTVQERSVTGGTIGLRGAGDIIVAPKASLNVSGGQTVYAAGYINTSKLLGADGKIYDIGSADPTIEYDAVLHGPVVTHERWGVTQTFPDFQGAGTFEPGYVQGADAGSVTAFAPRLVIDGDIDAATSAGRLQRQPPSQLSAGAKRPFDQVPLPGSLVLGNSVGPPDAISLPDYAIGALTFQAGSTLPGLANPDGTPFDPLRDPLPDSVSGVRVDPRLLDPSRGGVGLASIYANGAITVPNGTTLDLGLGGTLSLTGSRIDVEGRVHAPGGALNINAVATHTEAQDSSVTLHSGSTLDVAGLWVNDEPLSRGGPNYSPLFISGGSISLKGVTVDLELGSSIDASGGGWLQASSALKPGVGGRISLAVADIGLLPTSVPPLSIEGDLAASAFAQGGTLSITTPWICISAGDCSAWRPDAFVLEPERLSAGQFENYSLTANRGLLVQSGAIVVPRQTNLTLSPGYALMPTGTALDQLSTPALLPDAARRPVNLQLGVVQPAVPELTLDSTNLATAGDLVVESGASIFGDVGSAIDLTTNTRMLIDGLIDAPAGRISATLLANARLLEFLPAQGIWLGSDAQLSARGVPVIQPDKNGLRTGAVRPGGTVAIAANRGSIVINPGALIDVGGGSGVVDMPTYGVGQRQFVPTTVYSPAGSVTLAAAESLILSGSVRAAGAAPDGSSAGGRIDIAVDASPRGSDPLGPLGPRTIDIMGGDSSNLAIGYGTAIPDSLNGRALVPSALLAASGADYLSFRTRDIRDPIDPTLIASYGQIVFSGDVTLAPRARLTLDAPIIASASGSAQLSASDVVIGHTDLTNQLLPSDVHSGDGTLNVNGGLVELVGLTRLDGFGNVQLRSSGDLRVTGVQPNLLGFDLVGGLDTSAALTLAAQQIYPTTFSDFAISSLPSDAGAGLIVVEGVGGAHGDVLSAGGHLSLSAGDIEQRGVLRAPIGTITLTADDVTLAPGSITSTTAAGLSIPFGTTQAGKDWVYTLPGAEVTVFGDSGRPFPSQQIELNAARIDFQVGARVDLSGGGDLQAYEFVPGLTGTQDVLSPLVRPNQFAILPGLSLAYAPFDTAESANFSLSPGDSVQLQDGVPGLPAGTYALLPARYALLPGAFLVTPTSGYTDIQPGQRFTTLDGETVVGGRHVVANTSISDSRSSGFAILSGSDVAREARYDITKATTFFAPADPSVASTERLPSDGGTLTLLPRQQLDLGGTLLTTAAPGGRGAAVDIASDNLRIVGDDSPAQAGEVVLRDNALVALNAESLLLGGRSVAAGDATQLDVLSHEVTIEAGARLVAPEITVAALDTITLRDGAELAASQTSTARSPQLSVTGDSAVLRIVGASAQASIVRDGAVGASGSIIMDSTAAIRSSGATLLDATANLVAGGVLDLSGSLALGAPNISLGDAPSGTPGLVLSAERIGALKLDTLTLRAVAPIDVYSAVGLAARSISIAAPGLRALSPAADLSVAADSLHLVGGASVQPPSSNDVGHFSAQVRTLNLDDGDFLFDDFAEVNLAATEDTTFVGSGSLAASGTLSLSARRFAGLSGNTYSIAGGGVLTLDSAGASGELPTSAPGLGVRLSLQGGSIVDQGRIEMPSGSVSLVGIDGSVSIGGSASIDVAGTVSTFDGVNVASPGGQVSITSRVGHIDIAPGAVVDVSAADDPNGRAGTLSLLAPLGSVTVGGTLRGAAADASLGATLELDAQSLPTLSQIAELAGTGFSAARSVRLRGPGDLLLPSTDTFAASSVDLDADQGAIRILGTIDASGGDGGQVRLFARDDVQVDGTIRADAATGDRGGRIDIGSATGGVRLSASSVLDASAPAAAAGEGIGGLVSIRVPRAALDTLIDSVVGNETVSLAGSVKAGKFSLEGFAVYNDADGAITATETAPSTTNPMYGDAAAFMSSAAALTAALGLGDNASFRIVPGIEVRSANDLSIQADWNLFDWRFNGMPGVLTLRANGDLTFNRSLSDGFASMTGASAFLLSPTGESWSYSLSAGNDLAAADPLATRTSWSLAPDEGNFVISAGTPSTGPQVAAVPKMVRTGTGTIDVSAGGDIRLGNRASVLYTAGVPGPGITLTGAGSIGGRAYPINGGDISLIAGGNIDGTSSNELVTDWLWRMGRSAGLINSAPTAWTVNYARFEQNVATLGGGNIRVRAGGDIVNFSASLPTIGRQVGGTTAATSRVEVVGGGDLDVRAGGSILGGGYYVGKGTGLLIAGDDFAEGPATAPLTNGFAPWLALGDATLDVVARGRLTVNAITNPTLVPQGRSQGVIPNVNSSYFSTYSDTSAVDLMASGGDLTFAYREVGFGAGSIIDQLTSINFAIGTDQFVLRVLPPSVRGVSFDGNIQMLGNASLFPSPLGNLDLFAGKTVTIGSSEFADGANVWLSDADPTHIGTMDLPSGSISTVRNALFAIDFSVPDFSADRPVHSAASEPDGRTDPTPTRIVAESGDVAFESSSRLFSPKPLHLVAGRDVLDARVSVYNLDDASVTSILAGRDLTFTAHRDATTGALTPSEGVFEVSGPGRVDVVAGRDVDLQTSRGITTLGNLQNLSLPENGASISVLAGIAGHEPDYDAFIDKYLVDSSAYDADLIAYMGVYSGSSPVGKQQALADFRLLSRSQQRGLLNQILIDEIRAGGRSAAQPGKQHDDFTRAFAALETLFPGSNPDVDHGEQNPYSGDIRLFFSRIYTLDGGDVDLFAPGGGVDVGLSTPPTAFGLSKSPSELGIVAQSTGNVAAVLYGDLQVNESRVFAADGGDILVWSTRGDIDAGRGAKTAISAPPPIITFDQNGRAIVTFPAALTGSGIQTLATSEGRKPGDVDLFAPRGVVNAGDAGIVAGNLTIAATAVLGADNISVSGTAVGVPVDTGGLGAALTGVSAVAASAANTAEQNAAPSRQQTQSETPLAAQALGFLDIFVTGFGESCDPSDPSCPKDKQKQ